MISRSGQIRLESGLEWLDEWSANACQAARNAVYTALFAISEGSVFWTHLTLGDARGAEAFFVLVRPDLVLKIQFHDPDAFGILYVGRPDDAPGYGLDLAG
jgi:hypothetical protein